MAMLLRWLALAIFLASVVGSNSAGAADQRYSLDGLSVYSDLNFSDEAGDYYGLQIVFVRSYKSEKVLWRSAAGKLDEPLLLDAVKTRNGYKVIVPDDDDSFGEWLLTITGTTLKAVGPRGLKFNLKKRL
jgi:hypothetical protein